MNGGVEGEGSKLGPTWPLEVRLPPGDGTRRSTINALLDSLERVETGTPGTVRLDSICRPETWSKVNEIGILCCVG